LDTLGDLLSRGFDPIQLDAKGGVGNMISGVLQTKGMMDQAKMLIDFKEIMVWIAALGWLFSICLAIGSVAVFGDYRQGAYLLVGPALFYFMIETKTNINGTDVRIGDRQVEDADGQQKTLLDFVTNIGGGTDVEVSFFFALYDEVVTELVQAIVEVFIQTAEKEDLRVVARERALNFVLHSTAQENGFNRLIGEIHHGQCARVFNSIIRQADAGLKNVPKKIREDDDLTDDLDRMMGKPWTNPIRPVDNESVAFLIAMKNGGVKGFEDVPFTDPQEIDKNNASCEEIWNWVRYASYNLAGEKLLIDNFLGSVKSQKDDIPWEQAYADMKKWIVSVKSRILDAAGVAVTNEDEKAKWMLASYIYKNSLENSTIAALSSSAFNRAPFNAKEFELVYGPLSRSEAHGGFFKLNYFAKSVPYIQGMLLYLLSIAFPFFAVLLVVPGRAASFMVWCSLWAWVKSWDVGFAIIHVARDIMWNMLGDQTNIWQEQLDWSEPQSVVSIIYNNDPMFSQTTYWELTALMTVSVPFITAHLCLGATGLYDMFKNSIDQTAQKFGDIERKRSRRFVGNVKEAQIRNEQMQLQLAAMNDQAAKMSGGAGGGGPKPSKAPLANGNAGAGGGAGAGGAGAAGAGGAGAAGGGAAGRAGQKSGLLSNSGTGKSQLLSSSGGDTGQATTMSGSPISRWGMDKAMHLQATSQWAAHMGQLGDINYQAQLRGDKAAAEASGEAHFMTGLQDLDSKAEPETMEQIYGSKSAVEAIFGKSASDVTWGEIYQERSAHLQGLQADLAGIVGRKMTGNVRSQKNIASLLSSRQKVDMFQRDKTSAADVLNIPGAASLSVPAIRSLFNFFNGEDTRIQDRDDLSRPGLDNTPRE
jgi:hypothetical protein